MINKPDRICLDIREGVWRRQIIQRHVFSLDTGKTWKFLGFCGGRLRPIISDNADAIKWLNRYRTCKRIGYAQLFIICPLCYGILINYDIQHPHPSVDTPVDPFGAFGMISILTGMITNNIIAPNFLAKSVQKYNHESFIGVPDFEISYNVSYNNFIKAPQLSMFVKF